ncbi:MAG: PAS domain S-box protein [Anaerolineae bacterium]|nr:PAS domain S-box protein [Anaerolineae bacterium]
MFDSIGEYLKSHVFADEEQNIKVRLLQISLLTLFFGSIVGVIIGLFVAYGSLSLMFSSMVIGTLISYSFLRAGKLRSASLFILVYLLVPLMVYLGVEEGIQDSIASIFPILILIASMLLDKRDYAIYALVVFLSTQGLILCELTGIISNELSHFITPVDMFAWGALTFVLIALGHMFSDSLRRSLAEVNQSNRSLKIEIEHRKKAEEALAAEGIRRRILIEQSHDGIVVLHQDGSIYESNQRFAKMLGYSPEEASHLHVWDWEFQFTREQVRDMLGTGNEAGRSFETQHRRKDGTIYDAEISSNGAVFAGEKLTFCVCRDITDRKQAEQQLAASEGRLSDLVSTMSDWTWEVDANAVYTHCSAKVESILGYRDDEIIGKTPFDFMAPGEAERVGVVFGEIVRDKRLFRDLENMNLTKDGRRVCLLTSGVPILADDGELLGYRGVDKDITDRKKAEEALRELNATLESRVAARTAEIRAEKEKSETILSSVGDAIMMFDRELRIQYINPAFTTLTGYTAEEALGRHPSSVGAAAGSGQVQSSIESALAEGRQWQGEVPSQRKDGRNYHAALTVSPLRDAGGNLTGFVSSHQDISQRKNLERARIQFQANVSHQFRTPVTTLQLYVHLMQQAVLPEETRNHLRKMGEEIAWLIHLMQDILEMTALDSGKATTTWEPVSLSDIVAATITRYQSQAGTSGLTLTAAPLPPALPVVEGDQARLGQALGEVVENAIVFTPPSGQVTLSVETAEDEGQTWVVIAVQDTGPGIPPEEQDKVFDRFFRGTIAESGHTPGVGLGLSIAQEILRAHGGRVTVESGKAGSTFRLWLRAGSG